MGSAPTPVDLTARPDTEVADLRFAVVDVETTGLDPRRHHILQIAVVVVDGTGRPLSEWSSYVRPPHGRFSRLGPRRIHGIRHRDLRGAPRLAEALDLADPHLRAGILTAHNLPFDRAFLDAAAHRSGRPPIPGAGLCTLTVSRRLDRERRLSHRLGDLAARHGLTVTRPHDARADAEATAAVIAPLLALAGVTTAGELSTLLLADPAAVGDGQPS